MDATCAIQASIHVFSLVRKYVSRILGTYQAYHLCIWRFLIDLYLPVYPIYGNIKAASHPFGKTLVSLKVPL